MAGKYRNFCRALPWLARVADSAVTCILTLGVLADNDPVKFAAVTIAQGGLGASEDLGWAYVGVLLKRLTDGEAQAPEGNVARHV